MCLLYTPKSLSDEPLWFVISSLNFTTLLHQYVNFFKHEVTEQFLWLSMSLFPGGQMILASSVSLWGVLFRGFLARRIFSQAVFVQGSCTYAGQVAIHR